MGEGRILIRLFGILLFLTSRLKFMQEYAFNKAHSSMRDTSQFYIRISVHLCITLFLPLVAEVQDGVPGGFGKVPGGPGRVTGALSKGTRDHGKA